MRIEPFRAFHYDPDRVGALADVVAPPYDVIEEAEIARLHERSPYNAVRLIMNREADRYGAAAAEFSAWRAAGVLVPDEEPALYYYVQNFHLRDGRQFERAGVMAAVRLEAFSSGRVMPHERTLGAAKKDRLRLMEACRANLSPIFGIFPDDAAAMALLRDRARTRAAWIDVTDDGGERHRVWRIPEVDIGRKFDAVLCDKTILIADGHHRYETALTYRDRRRARGEGGSEDPDNFILMYLTSMEDPGLVILPTHRVLRRCPAESRGKWLARLDEFFTVEKVGSGAAGVRRLRECIEADPAPGRLGLVLPGGDVRRVLLREPDMLNSLLAHLDPTIRRLDSTVVDALLLRSVLGVDCGMAAERGWLTFTPDDREALAAVGAGAEAAFLVRAPGIDDVHAAAAAGETMPEKSTYFYPKLLTGLVFRAL